MGPGHLPTPEPQHCADPWPQPTHCIPLWGRGGRALRRSRHAAEVGLPQSAKQLHRGQQTLLAAWHPEGKPRHCHLIAPQRPRHQREGGPQAPCRVPDAQPPEGAHPARQKKGEGHTKCKQRTNATHRKGTGAWHGRFEELRKQGNQRCIAIAGDGHVGSRRPPLAPCAARRSLLHGSSGLSGARGSAGVHRGSQWPKAGPLEGKGGHLISVAEPLARAAHERGRGGRGDGA